MAQSSKPDNASGPVVDALDFQRPDQAGPASQGTQTDSTPRAAVATAWWQSQFNLMVAVFALLVLAALLFIMLSPKPDAANVSTIYRSDGSQQAGSAVSQAEEEGETPFNEQQNQLARGDAQNVLSSLLIEKRDLETRAVTTWAPNEFQAAVDLAEQGDDFYSRKNFIGAEKSYQQALLAMQNLKAEIPDRVARLVSQGQAAIESGKASLAREKFQAALQIDSNEISALTGLDRSKSLDQVLELLREGQALESEFSETDQLELLETAQTRYQTAAEIDADYQPISTALAAIADRINDKQFRDAMTNGFNGLLANRYSQAKNGFSAALKIQPGNTTALAAYRQALASDSRASLSSLMSSAQRAEANEEWATALGNYQTILQRDPNQVSAKVGQVRSQVRLELSQSLDSYIDDPLSVTLPSKREAAENILNEARALAKKGPIVEQQIAQLSEVLKQADADVKVALTSDALTEITLEREGTRRLQLGKFTTRKLALKPGRYTITGTRLGFRDVRRQIDLFAQGDKVLAFHLVCDEPVSAVQSEASTLSLHTEGGARQMLGVKP